MKKIFTTLTAFTVMLALAIPTITANEVTFDIPAEVPMGFVGFSTASAPITNPQGGVADFTFDQMAYANGNASFRINVQYGGGNATSGTLSWTGATGEISYTPLVTTTTGNPRFTRSTFTVEQACLEQTMVFTVTLQTNQGPQSRTLNVIINGLGCDPGAEADCVNDQICIVCEEVLVEAFGHDWIPIYTEAPTCEEDGYTWFECSRCDVDGYEGEIKQAIGHNFRALKVPMTPWTDGYTLHTCIRWGCGFSYKDNWEYSVPLGWEAVGTVLQTCTTWGYTVFESDPHWGLTKKGNWVQPNGHDYVGVVTAPTCTAEGFTTYTCLDCGHDYVDNWVNALGHEYVAVSAVSSSMNLQNSTRVNITVIGKCVHCGDTRNLVSAAPVTLRQSGTQVVNVGGYTVTVVVNSNNKITDVRVGGTTSTTGGNSQGSNSQGSNSQGGNSQR